MLFSWQHAIKVLLSNELLKVANGNFNVEMKKKKDVVLN